VLLTDSVELASPDQGKGNPDEVVWMSWYGEREAVALIDWECLKGRDILYIVQERPGRSRAALFRTALSVCRKLDGQRGTRVTVVEIAPDLGRSRVWSAGEFCTECQEWLQVDSIPPPTGNFAPVSMKSIATSTPKKRAFLLEPFLAERSTTLIFSRTNLGKTWFSIAMGTALAHGSTVFGRWRAPRARKVLYIDSEMDEISMRTRVAAVARMVFDGRKLPRKHRQNFHIVSRSRSGGDTEAFKRECVAFVEMAGVSLVVLDNITAFTQHNDSAKAWEDIHVWIDELKKHNCAVVLIHHENRAGQQRGTSATTNAVDNVLHLVDPESEELRSMLKQEAESGYKSAGNEPGKPSNGVAKSDDALKMKVLVEKGRDIHGASREPFLVLMRPSGDPPICDGCALEFMDDGSFKGVKRQSAALSRGRGSRRNKRPVGEIVQEMLEEIRRGSTIKEASTNHGVSDSWLRNRLNQDGDAAMIEQLERALEIGTGTRQRESRKIQEWIANNAGELGCREAARRKQLSESTARRMHDDYWTERIKEEIPEEKRQSRRISERFGLDPKVATRLLKRIMLDRVLALRFREQAMSYAEIAEELGVPANRVATVCRTEESRLERARDRKDALLRVQKLHMEEMPEDEIIAEVELPAKTIKTALGKLLRSAQEFERMLPSVKPRVP
jgi:hypothetical protein